MSVYEKGVIAFLFIGAIGTGVFLGLDLKESREARAANPFTKIGALGTNGVVAEVFKFEQDCYVIVSTVPGEHGRAYMQMECK